MTTFLSLVDDVLRRTFESIVTDHHEDGAFNSLKLSHISRRCRIVALSSPGLWTHIRHGPKLLSTGFVEACLERSRGRPLDIIITVVPSRHRPIPVSVNSFVEAIQNAADRCRSLRIHHLLRPYDDQTVASFTGPYLESNLWIGDGAFPELEALNIHFPMLLQNHVLATGRWLRMLQETPRPFPKLKILSVMGFTPIIRMTHYDNLVELNFKTSDLGCSYLTEFLASSPSLRDLNITFLLTSNGAIRFTPKTLSMPTIRHFRFNLFVDGHLKVGNALTFIFSQLVFSNLPSLQLHIEFLDKYNWERQWDEPFHWAIKTVPDQLDFGQYLKEIIRKDGFPALESLVVTLAAKSQTTPAYPYPTFAIPVQFLPKLNRLELQSDLLLSSDLEYYDLHGDGDPPCPGGLSVVVNARLLCEAEWLRRLNGRILE